MEQIVDVPVPPVADEIVGVHQERISECIVEQIVCGPVSQILEETVEVEKPFGKVDMPDAVEGQGPHGPDSAEHRHDTS